MTLPCTRCGTANRDTARFCSRCGGPLPAAGASFRFCPQCGHSNRQAARFCLRCGRSFQAPPPPAVSPYGTGQLPPQTIVAGRYLILKRVGKGGMGAVYRVADTRLSGKVWALKEMSGSTLPDPVERQQAVDGFLQEAQLLATLSHPAIPQVGDVFPEGPRYYLTMEFVEGETLQQKLDRLNGKGLPPDDVLRWACQLCEVLSYLHRLQPPIIFRDLKPANIMVTPNGDVKLIDFGIARFFKAGKKTDTVKIGTQGYAPPEQYGKGQTDARSDVYALGATLHHLLTGSDPSSRPFYFDDVCRLAPKVPAAFGQAVMRSLAMKPADRWQSADDMLQAVRGGRAAPAHPGSAVQPHAAPAPVVAPPCPTTHSLSDLMPGTGLRYQESEPGTFVVPFKAPTRSQVVLIAHQFNDLVVIGSQVAVPRWGRDKALETLLRGSFGARLVKVVGTAKDGYLVSTELFQEQITSRVLEVAMRGLVAMADLEEKHTSDHARVEQAAAGCTGQWLSLSDRLSFDWRSVCQRESIPFSDLGGGRYRLMADKIQILLELKSSVVSFFLLTDTKPRSNRREAFYHRMLEANVRLKVVKAALDSDGTLAFVHEVPVTGLTEEGFHRAFMGPLFAAQAYWEELEKLA